MKITDIKLGMLRVPLKTPFKTALRTVDAIEDVIVMVHTDSGHVGYGEVAQTAVITGDTHGSIIYAIDKLIKPRLIGMDVADLDAIVRAIQTSMAHNTSPKAGVEIAVHDLWAQLYGAPLYKLLGGGEPVLDTNLTISVDAIDKMVADALAALARGFGTLKIKLGKDVRTDIERVKAIHAAVAGRASLRLDANQGWTPKQAVYAMNKLEDAGIALELLEQPVKGSDVAGLKYVSERVLTPVMADEAAFDVIDTIELLHLRAADIINIKLMKCGGISNAIRIADVAAGFGVECMIGCMLESSISVAAAAHLGVAKRGTITKADLDGPGLSVYDPVDGNVRFNDAEIRIGDAPGLGITSIRGLEMLET